MRKSFKRNKKKKVMVTIWSDSKDTSSNEEGKAASLYLMALEDNVNSKPNLEFIFDELHLPFMSCLLNLRNLV